MHNTTNLSLIAGEVKALNNLWLVGDKFLYTVYDQLQSLRTEALVSHAKVPYVYDHYNPSQWHLNPMAHTEPAIARIYNSLVKALNDERDLGYPPLPKYVVIIPDKDIVESVNIWDYGVSSSIQCNVYWLLHQMSKALLTRREDLKGKWMGAVTGTLTRIIWVKMLTRPMISDSRLKKIFALKRKFNDILAEFIELEASMHLIEIPNMEEHKYFNKFGDLTNSGKRNFWRGFCKALKSLDQEPSPTQHRIPRPSGREQTASHHEHEQHRHRLNHRHHRNDTYHM